jgi:hypothetical protein
VHNDADPRGERRQDNVLHLLQLKSGNVERYGIMLQATKYGVVVAVTFARTRRSLRTACLSTPTDCAAYLRENNGNNKKQY